MTQPGHITRHQTADGPRWALDGQYLPQSFTLAALLAQPRDAMTQQLQPSADAADGALLPPLESDHEVWASGVTYLRSRDARQAESSVGDVYATVYDAERPELFLKALGWRVVAPDGTVYIRHDSTWDVPEPEIVLVVNSAMEIIGYCAGNDMSSRSIEGENPLYLPQAKIYDGSCALGPGIQLAAPEDLRELPVHLTITRDGEQVFAGETGANQMKRHFEELVQYLGVALAFPHGVFLMTGTGVVPPESFTLRAGDQVEVQVGALTLRNVVDRHGERAVQDA